MPPAQEHVQGRHAASVWRRTGAISIVASLVMVLGRAEAIPLAAQIQQSQAAASLVLDGVTVVDIEQGKLLPRQRVVITGHRIVAVGDGAKVNVPSGARVVNDSGRYLIPGLWDMHVHNFDSTYVYSPFMLAGVTGVRDMGTPSLESIPRWRREVAAGTRVGPRLVVAGPYLGTQTTIAGGIAGIRITTPADGRRIVDSLKAAGVDFIKVRDSFFDAEDNMSRDVYFAVAAEARRVGLPFAGHPPTYVSLEEASDSGQRSFEHGSICTGADGFPCVPNRCLGLAGQAIDSVVWQEACVVLAARMIRNGTWFTPTIMFMRDETTVEPPPFLWLTSRAGRFGIPLLAGTDTQFGGGSFSESRPGLATKIHAELALFVEAGLTPLQALQAATLNPAKYLNATDSLGTIARGKLADLVVLDANPMDDIHATRQIRAVVANGRYFDRAALDSLAAAMQAAAGQVP